MDSLAFFFIGGDVEPRVNWPLDHIERLTSAGRKAVVNDFKMVLDTHDEVNQWPGQPWHYYKSKQTSRREDRSDKDLKKSLTELLTPTTPTEAWDARRGPNGEVYWLRFRQKPTGKNNFLVNGQVHSGAHMPLLVFTNSPQSNRSQDVEQDRRKESSWSSNQWSSNQRSSDQWSSNGWWRSNQWW